MKPKRRNLKHNVTVSKYDKKKLYALILFQSGAGSGQIITSSTNNNKNEESIMMIDPRYPNNKKELIYLDDFQKIPGVTPEDIFFSRNVAYKSIFSHLKFSEIDIVNTLKKIKDLGIAEKIIKLSMRGEEEKDVQLKLLMIH